MTFTYRGEIVYNLTCNVMIVIDHGLPMLNINTLNAVSLSHTSTSLHFVTCFIWILRALSYQQAFAVSLPHPPPFPSLPAIFTVFSGLGYFYRERWYRNCYVQSRSLLAVACLKRAYAHILITGQTVKYLCNMTM